MGLIDRYCRSRRTKMHTQKSKSKIQHEIELENPTRKSNSKITNSVNGQPHCPLFWTKFYCTELINECWKAFHSRLKANVVTAVQSGKLNPTNFENSMQRSRTRYLHFIDSNKWFSIYLWKNPSKRKSILNSHSAW